MPGSGSPAFCRSRGEERGPASDRRRNRRPREGNRVLCGDHPRSGGGGRAGPGLSRRHTGHRPKQICVSCIARSISRASSAISFSRGVHRRHHWFEPDRRRLVCAEQRRAVALFWVVTVNRVAFAVDSGPCRAIGPSDTGNRRRRCTSLAAAPRPGPAASHRRGLANRDLPTKIRRGHETDPRRDAFTPGLPQAASMSARGAWRF